MSNYNWPNVNNNSSNSTLRYRQQLYNLNAPRQQSNTSVPSYGGLPGDLIPLSAAYLLNNSLSASSFPPTTPIVRRPRPDDWWRINNDKRDSSFEPKLNPVAEVGISLRNEEPSAPRTDGFGYTHNFVNAISSNIPDDSTKVVSQFSSLATSNSGSVRPAGIPEPTGALRPDANGYDPSMQNDSYPTEYKEAYGQRQPGASAAPPPAGTLQYSSRSDDSFVVVNQDTNYDAHGEKRPTTHLTVHDCELTINGQTHVLDGVKVRRLSPLWRDASALYLDSFPADVLFAFVHVVTHDRLPDLITMEHFVGFYRFAKKCEITDEKFNTLLFNHIQNHVSVDHSALLFYYKNLWEYTDVKKMCAKGFLYDAEEILSQLDAVKELGFEQMNAIFSMDPLEVHELTMFKVLTTWASEPKRNKGDVLELLRKIRFGAFPLLDYYSASGPFHAKGLLNDEEKMKVVRQISSGANSGFSPKARLRSKDVMEVHLTRGLIEPRDSETDVPYAISFVVSKPVRVICMYKITGSRLTDQLKVRWALMEGVDGAKHPNGGPFTEKLMGNLGSSPHIVTDLKYPVLQLKRETIYTLVATFSSPVVLSKMADDREYPLEHPSYSNVVCQVLDGVPKGLKEYDLRAAFNDYGSGYGQYNDHIDFSAIHKAVHATPFTTLYFLPC